MIEHSYLKEILFYDPLTGHFIWKVDKGSNKIKGKIAGNLDKSTGYIRIQINKKRYLSHVLAWFYMTGKWPEI